MLAHLCMMLHKVFNRNKNEMDEDKVEKSRKNLNLIVRFFLLLANIVPRAHKS